MSSGATIPARAPASMVILHTDILASMDMFSKTSPQNSMTLPVPPAVPITPMMCKMTSLEVTPSANLPETLTRMFFALFMSSVCVAKTCSTSDVPIPKARAPNAPCVEVWLSPQTTVVPGRVNPCSGPMTCTMPCRLSSIPKYVRPNACTLSSSVTTCCRESASSIKLLVSLKLFRDEVGMLWSTVARVQSVRRTSLLLSLRPSNA
mmetsp:Transcript_112255/g.267615  ORF Transcript_112255/g.267615 Transcript_112255/m.267615 type:complete len:206 (+) Transcript_112255:1845-2462(+)